MNFKKDGEEMVVVDRKNILHCISDEIMEEYKLHDLDSDTAILSFWKEFMREGYEEYINIYSKKYAFQYEKVVLEAHGDCEKTSWMYADNKMKSVAGFVRKYDGIAGLIWLIVCNPMDEIIKTKKSLVLYANDEFSALSMNYAKGVHSFLFSPIHGQLDSYTVNHDIEELKNMKNLI